MRHDITMEGVAFRLRPVTEADSEFIVSLRGDPRINRYINIEPGHGPAHLQWLNEYYKRESDYYFIIESRKNSLPEGTVGIYFVNPESREAEWGRWIVRWGSMAAVEGAWLTYRVGFDVLGLDVLYCRTLAENTSVVNFHTSCGCLTRGRIANYLTLRGVSHDAVEQRMPRNIWQHRGPHLEAMVTRIGNRLLP